MSRGTPATRPGRRLHRDRSCRGASSGRINASPHPSIHGRQSAVAQRLDDLARLDDGTRFHHGAIHPPFGFHVTLGITRRHGNGELLVIDDDLGMRETYGIALQHAGYHVRLADSGDAAILALSSGAEMHAILLDLKLGDRTGYDVLRWMRAHHITVPSAHTDVLLRNT